MISNIIIYAATILLYAVFIIAGAEPNTITNLFLISILYLLVTISIDIKGRENK